MKILLLIIKIIDFVSNFISRALKYNTVYEILGIFFTRKFKHAKSNHKYAILIAARNEETVIGNLLDSIKHQDYPQELLTVFVAADNCTDKTAKIARKFGAVCHERFNTTQRTKGYALQFLVDNIKRDYGIESFEGYFIFDADNLLKKDYISRMNESFDAGEKIIASYRNTKNFSHNWISASYGIHWLRTIRNEHRARSLLHLATRIQGTGFLFASELIRNGWNYVSFTEDRAFCADAVSQGYQISYNHDAQFYDEQPISMKIALRQRIRWAKGHLQAFVEVGPKLLKHIFITDGNANRNCYDAPWYKRIFNNIKFRFMSLDMLSIVYPRALMILFKRIAKYYIVFLLVLMGWQHYGFHFGNIVHFNGAKHDAWTIIGVLTFSAFLTSFINYFEKIFTAVYIFIVEHKRIEYIPIFKKILYCITFPIFDIIGKFALLIALFKKVEWKTIPHTSNIKIDDIHHKNKIKLNYTTKT